MPSYQERSVPILTQSEDWALYHQQYSIFRPLISVPILTQSEDWALFQKISWLHQLPMFQSSPSPKTGRYIAMQRVGYQIKGSNPHPVRRLGAIRSILILATKLCSNPHPVRRLGAMNNTVVRTDETASSNPHPVRRLGAMIQHFFFCPPSESVPILTQSEDWALCPSRSSHLPTFSFQSSPSPKTGRYVSRSSRRWFDCVCSNPHPVRRLGAMQAIAELKADILVPILTQSEDWALFHSKLTNLQIDSSNPHPVRRLGAILIAFGANVEDFPVPILTQSEDWALSPTLMSIYFIRVPILTQSEDWALLKTLKPERTLTCSNPHPVRRLGAIIPDLTAIVNQIFVPILTQSEDWALLKSRSSGQSKCEFQSSPSPKTGRYL